MRSARTLTVQAIAVAAALGLTACAGSSETAQAVNETAASEAAAFASCSTASITVDRSTRYQAPIAGFLEEARTSGCSYGGIQIAFAPEEARGDAKDHDDAVAVARDFIDAFDLAWRIQPEANDPDLSLDSLRVTLLTPNEFAAAQTATPQYR